MSQQESTFHNHTKKKVGCFIVYLLHSRGERVLIFCLEISCVSVAVYL